MKKQVKTTDNPCEIFDIVNQKDQVIGRATRAECHNNSKLIHRSIHVLVFNSQRELFLQKRSTSKDVCPGMWAASVSGHVDAGENYESAAERETKEEIGTPLPLKYLDTCYLEFENETEFSAVYVSESEGPFQLNPKEIETGGFFSVDHIKNRMWNEIAPPSQTVLKYVMEKHF